MLRCPAWKMLDPDAKALLLEVWARHNGTNNGQISYACREAEEIGLSRNRASRAFTLLQQLGFLRMRAESWFDRKGGSAARQWEVTAESVEGQPATKGYMRVGVPPKSSASVPPTGHGVPPTGHKS